MTNKNKIIIIKLIKKEKKMLSTEGKGQGQQ